MESVRPKIKCPEKRPPDIAQPTDDDNQKGLDDDGVIHALGNVLGGGHQRASQSRQVAADNEYCGKHPADIDADGTDHFPVDGGGACNFSDFGLVGQKP
jgi:hypothetical protein